MTTARLAFLPIVRTTFDVTLAQQMIDQARAQLEAADFVLISADEPLTTLDEARETAQTLASETPDLLLIFQATFADSTMTLELAQSIDAPLVLWGVPEALTGGRLRLNALCGINLSAHALKRAGIPYETLYALPGDPDVIEKLTTLARAGQVRARLRGARIGRVGEHPAGFDTCRYDAAALRERLGVEVVPIDLREQVFAGARAADPQAVRAALDSLRARLDGLDAVDGAATRGTISAYVALRGLAESARLDGCAVRCWPEFFTEMGCAACGALSLLSDEHTPCSCEADVNGTLTQLILQWISGSAAFGTDVVAVNQEFDGLVLWHCGLAPLSMADAQTRPTATIHSNRKLPLLMEFALRPGVVTVARLSEAAGEYRLVVGRGEMLAAPKSFSGTSGVLRFERSTANTLATILEEGLEHHIALTYGDHVDVLLALAKMLKLPVLRL